VRGSRTWSVAGAVSRIPFPALTPVTTTATTAPEARRRGVREAPGESWTVRRRDGGFRSGGAGAGGAAARGAGFGGAAGRGAGLGAGRPGPPSSSSDTPWIASVLHPMQYRFPSRVIAVPVSRSESGIGLPQESHGRTGAAIGDPFNAGGERRAILSGSSKDRQTSFSGGRRRRVSRVQLHRLDVDTRYFRQKI